MAENPSSEILTEEELVDAKHGVRTFPQRRLAVTALHYKDRARQLDRIQHYVEEDSLARDGMEMIEAAMRRED